MKRREMKALVRAAVRPVVCPGRALRSVEGAQVFVTRHAARVRLSDWDLREGTFSLGCALRRAGGVYASDVVALRDARRRLWDMGAVVAWRAGRGLVGGAAR